VEGRPGRARHPGGVAPARGPQGVQGGELGAENPAGDATYGLRGHRSPPAVEGRRPTRKKEACCVIIYSSAFILFRHISIGQVTVFEIIQCSDFKKINVGA